MYKCARCNSPSTQGSVYCTRHNSTPSIARPRIQQAHNKGFYNTRRWYAIRKQVLGQQPICQCCNRYGMVKPAVDVDHIYPLSHSPTLGYATSNMQALCKGCHSRKTNYEKQGLIYDYTMGRITNINTGDINTMP